MTDKRLWRLFAGLVAVVMLSTAAAPLTAFGDDLPPPAPSDESGIATTTETSSTGSNHIVGSSGNLIVGSSGNLIVGSSGNQLMMLPYLDDYSCSIGATVSFNDTTVNPANGDPIVTLKLERLEGDRTKQTWFVTRRFEDGSLAKEFRFENLPRGSYRLTQLPLMRYTQLPYRRGSLFGEEKDVNCSWGADCYSDKVIARYDFYMNGSTGQAFIRNKQTTADWLSDTDLAVNKIVLPQGSGGGGGCGDDDHDDND